MPAKASFLFPSYSINGIGFSHFQAMALPWDFFVTNEASNTTSLVLLQHMDFPQVMCFLHILTTTLTFLNTQHSAQEADMQIM
jgi:hypothetical protein